MKVIGSLQVLGKQSIIQFNAAPSTNLEYSGWITTETVAVPVTPGQCLYFDVATNTWKLAQANSANTLPCRAIALETKNTSQLCKILRFGTLKNDAWTLTGTGIYVSPTIAGGLTSTQPNTTGQFVQMLGTPCSQNVGLFDFSPMYIEIA